MTESSKVALMTAKILMFSRSVEIDKIAEALGGRKDEQTKLLLRNYCSLIDYRECKLQKSMRAFLQSFRMAGVESDCIFRIIEVFATEFFNADHKKQFSAPLEAYEFGYLLIVLHTQ